MSLQSAAERYRHSHTFNEGNPLAERNTLYTVLLTATMMVVEIAGGWVFNSMALLADGWHMSSHAVALGLSVFAYACARRYANDKRFAFGTWKIEILGGYTSAVLLLCVAGLMAFQSIERLISPFPIHYNQAIALATVGLVVNLVCAWLLKDDHAHHAHHGHAHGHGHHHDHDDDHHAPGKGRDNNLRAAYVHVLADALTSILAIVALLLGRSYGWLWADPLMGVIGALVIARWSWGLIQDSGSVLLEAAAEGQEVRQEIREAMEPTGSQVTDLHVWQVGPGHFAAIVSLMAREPKEPVHYKALLAHIHELSHVTVEVQRATT